VNEKYSAFSSALLKIIDKIAPLKSVKIKDKDDQTPWVDLILSQLRDKAYSCCSVELGNIDNLRALNIMTEEIKIKLSELEVKYNEYKKFYDYSKSNYQRLYRNKITDYFQTKTIEDFKNMKDYWNFNAAHISLKLDKTSSNSPQSLVINGLEVNDKRIMANEFNSFFTNLSSCSNESDIDCINYVEDTFDKLDTDSEKYLYNNFKLLKTKKLESFYICIQKYKFKTIENVTQ
jgi:hypothetical protein